MGEFQSTHLREVRPLDQIECDHHRLVSIHAPTRGATPNVTEGNVYLYCFNPRTYERCDTRGMYHLIRLGVSIHAPARGATCVRIVSFPKVSFNPRTCERCDSTILKIVAQRYIKAAFCETYNQVRFYSINSPSHSDYTLILNTCETLNNHVPQPVRIFI